MRAHGVLGGAIAFTLIAGVISRGSGAQTVTTSARSDDYGKRICEWDGWLPPETGRARYLAAKELTGEEEDVLRLALQSHNPQRRDMAARRLAASRESRSLDALLALENDSSPIVREGMLRSLGRIGSLRAEPVLIRAMAQKDKHIKQAAAWSLGQLRSARAVGVLTAAARDTSEHVRSEAAWAFGMIGDKSMLPLLYRLTADREKAVRLASVCAIGWLGGEVPRAALADTSVAVRAAIGWTQHGRR